MTKEEILRKHYNDFCESHPEVRFEDFDKDNDSQQIGYKAMDEYAEAVAIGFAEWMRDNNYEWDYGEDAWVGTTENEDNLIITTKEAFQIYKQSI